MAAIITNLAMIGGLYTTVATFTGLLDTLTTQPASAYSTRKLRSGYSGSAIRVRRSSDNTESDIGFTASGNLDETALLAFCGSGSGFVRTWYDQKGATNLTQTTTGNQPRIVSSGVVVKANSRPTVEALAGSVTFMNASYSNTGTQILVSGVFSMRTPSATYGRLSSFGVAGQQDFNNVGYMIGLVRNNGSANVNANRNGDFGGNLSYDTLNTYTTGFTGMGGTLRLNGTQAAMSVVMGNFNISLFRLFNNVASTVDPWDGVCSEVLLFNTYPATADLTAIQNSQKAYFGTP